MTPVEKTVLPRQSAASMVVDAPAGLVAQTSGVYQLAKLRAGEVLLIAKLLVEHHHDVMADVKADEIRQPEGGPSGRHIPAS